MYSGPGHLHSDKPVLAQVTSVAVNRWETSVKTPIAATYNGRLF